MSHEEVLRLLAALRDAGWHYAHIQVGEWSLTVSKGDVVFSSGPSSGIEHEARISAARTAVGPVSDSAVAPPPDVRSSELETTGQLIVRAPTVGTFWRSPQPGAPPFVEEGRTVAASDTLCILEVMKLMTQVLAPVPGVIAKIYPNNGDLVEYGGPLFLVDPAPTS